ncbi:hypothetical protein BGX23_010918 [Mortierella sp. AD031]|nr:hypothetical protein BGX23_010918 [Mortierella sp. AD031]
MDFPALPPQCITCGAQPPEVGSDCLLVVSDEELKNAGVQILCRHCRTAFFALFPEHEPAYLDLDAYEYDNQRYTFGPWVTMNEAKNRYALIAAQINDAELLGHWLGSVVEAAPRNPTRLMPERLVVRFARQIHGGQEGVERAHSLVPPHELLPIL